MEIVQTCPACGETIEMTFFEEPKFIRCPHCSNEVAYNPDEKYANYLERAVAACQEFADSMGDDEYFDR